MNIIHRHRLAEINIQDIAEDFIDSSDSKRKVFGRSRNLPHARDGGTLSIRMG